MRFIYAIAVWVLELIEESPGMITFFAWIGGTIAGIGLLHKVPYGPVWGIVVGLACAAAAWCLCWACGQGVKAIHRVHRPESNDLKKARDSGV